MSQFPTTGAFQQSFPALPKRPVLPLPPLEKQANSFSWDYVKTVFEAFAERERALEYRIESLYFHAEKSLRALENPESGTQDSQNALHDANPILGIRLLQRLDQLQKENDDLSRRIEDLIDSTSMETIQSLRKEIQVKHIPSCPSSPYGVHLCPNDLGGRGAALIGEARGTDSFSTTATQALSYGAHERHDVLVCLDWLSFLHVMSSNLLLGSSRLRALNSIRSLRATSLWLPPALRTCTISHCRSRSEQLMYMQNEELNNTSDVEEDVKPIFYPDFSSVTQCFGVGTEIEDSHSDLDEYDQRLIEATAVWESSLSQNSGEMSGGLSLPSSLFHLTGQDTEDVMLKSVEYAESLQTATPSVCNDREMKHTVPRNIFPSRSHPFGHGNSSRSFSTSALRRAIPSTPYQLLGVSPTASAAEIKSQFYTIAKKLHPDKLDPNLTKKEKEEHLERFRLVVKAYELLKDRRQREMYDKYRMGWEGTTDMPPRTQWSSPSQFRPSTQAEWEQWYMWSEMLRRHGRSDHAHMWQRMARNHSTSYQFYGYAKVTPEDEKRQREAAPINHRIFFILFFLGSIIATIQIDGAKKYSTRDSSAAAQHTSMVARNLEQARMHARSEEGLMRQRLMLERARENKRAREQDQVPLLTS